MQIQISIRYIRDMFDLVEVMCGILALFGLQDFGQTVSLPSEFLLQLYWVSVP